MKPQN